MKEKISALMDAHLPDEEMDARLADLKRDPGLRQAWNTYHLIGDALRGHHGLDISARVAQRLAREPTVLAPALRTASRHRAAWFFLSAAASVAAVALVLWAALPMLRTQAEPGAAVVVAETKPPLAADEVENFLLAHQAYSHASAMQGLAPYIRTVADEDHGTDKP